MIKMAFGLIFQFLKLGFLIIGFGMMTALKLLSWLLQRLFNFISRPGAKTHAKNVENPPLQQQQEKPTTQRAIPELPKYRPYRR